MKDEINVEKEVQDQRRSTWPLKSYIPHHCHLCQMNANDTDWSGKQSWPTKLEAWRQTVFVHLFYLSLALCRTKLISEIFLKKGR